MDYIPCLALASQNVGYPYSFTFHAHKEQQLPDNNQIDIIVLTTVHEHSIPMYSWLSPNKRFMYVCFALFQADIQYHTMFSTLAIWMPSLGISLMY